MKRSLSVVGFILVLALGMVAQVPASKHVYLVALENRSYEHLVGNSNMPYLNSLFTKGTLATQFYANRHTSITDYFMVTSGVIPTTNDTTSSLYNVDNMVRHMMTMGKTFKVYAQALPYVGYAGLSSGAYMKRHTALPYYTDMGNSTTEMRKLVPVTELPTDISNGNMPNFAIISPDANHDLHNCSSGLSACEKLADSFLSQYLKPLLASAEFQPGGDGILIIWSDEADLSGDNRCSSTVSSGCGGHVVVSMVGPKVRVNYKSTVLYHHQNVLKTMLEALGETSGFPGASSSASAMNDFFTTSGTSGPTPTPTPTPISGIQIYSPAAGATVSSPVHISASTSATNITTTKVYVDGTSRYSIAGKTVDTYVSMSAGTHYITVQNWNSSGTVTKAHVTVNVP